MSDEYKVAGSLNAACFMSVIYLLNPSKMTHQVKYIVLVMQSGEEVK